MTTLNSSQFVLTECCQAQLVRLSMDNDDLPRCAGCGHRQAENGVSPVQTRERGPVAWATEIPNRLRAQWAGRAL